MNDINSVNITGNIANEPELRATRGGTAVLNFRIASNRSVKNKQTGEWDEVADFVGCTVMGNRAEPLSRLLGKGDKVAVSGSLRYHSWEARDGSKRSMLEVYAENVILMSKKGQRPASAPQTPQQPQSAPQQTADMYDYDLPF